MDERTPDADASGSAGAIDPETRVEIMAERLKERIYATITMVAVLVGLALGGHAGPAGAALSVAGTAVGLWLATLVADAQSASAVHGRRHSRFAVLRSLYVSSPLLLSAVSPLLLIGVSGLGLVKLNTALWTATGLNVLSLFLWGFVSGRRMGDRLVTALVAGLSDTAIGAVVVAVKVLAGH
ncbi:hypothetical protein [Actinomadura gamaensis]|uniref:Uncharacterized protein n=1 Tax=Actinomadura gamaensis TaxID=1763541 RepID=A0ABV9U6G9_9ACTN